MGTGSGRGVGHPPEVKERVELYLYTPSGPSWPVRGRTLLFNRIIQRNGLDGNRRTDRRYTNNTSDHGEMGSEGVNEIMLAWDRDQFRTFVIMVTDPVNF